MRFSRSQWPWESKFQKIPELLFLMMVVALLKKNVTNNNKTQAVWLWTHARNSVSSFLKTGFWERNLLGRTVKLTGHKFRFEMSYNLLILSQLPVIISQLSETITVCTLEDYHFWEGVPAQVLSPKNIQGHTEMLRFGMTGPQKTNPNTSLNTTFQGYSQGCLRIHAFQGGWKPTPTTCVPAMRRFSAKLPSSRGRKTPGICQFLSGGSDSGNPRGLDHFVSSEEPRNPW